MQVISLHLEHILLLGLCGTEAPTHFLAMVNLYESIPCGNGLHLQRHLPRSKETVQGWGKELYLHLGGWVSLSETSQGARFYNTLWLVSRWGKLKHKGSEQLAAPPGWFLAKCSIPGKEGCLREGFEVPPLPEEGIGLRRT